MVDPSELWPWIVDQLEAAVGRPCFLVGEIGGAPALPFLVVTPAYPAFDERSFVLRPPTIGTVLQLDAVGRNWEDSTALLSEAGDALRALGANPPVELGVNDLLIEAATIPGAGDSEQVVVTMQLFRVLASEVTG